jgi:hypothetical protein
MTQDPKAPTAPPVDAAGRRKLEEMLAWADSAGVPDAALAPLEYAPSIRLRNKDKRIITDDNMGTEWLPRT